MHYIIHVEVSDVEAHFGGVFDRFTFFLALSLWLLTMGSDCQAHVQRV
jgi:hypothetical protein